VLYLLYLRRWLPILFVGTKCCWTVIKCLMERYYGMDLC